MAIRVFRPHRNRGLGNGFVFPRALTPLLGKSSTKPVFIKEVVLSCSRIFTNFLLLGADLLRRIQPNLIHRAPVPDFVQPALWIPRFRYLMKFPSFLYNGCIRNKLSEYGLSSLTEDRLNEGTTPKRCKVASMVAPFIGLSLSEYKTKPFRFLAASPIDGFLDQLKRHSTVFRHDYPSPASPPRMAWAFFPAPVALPLPPAPSPYQRVRFRSRNGEFFPRFYLFYVQIALPAVFRKLLLIQTFCLDQHNRFLFTFPVFRVRLPCFLAFRSISPVLFLQP